MKKKYALIELGPLPIEKINLTLGTELDPGDAILTARAHKHIADDHSEEYDLVIKHLALVITDPTYIGQSPNHNNSFEMVRRLVVGKGQDIILAAINLTRNEFGNYNVHSAYRLTEDKVTARITKRHLFNTKKKAP